MDTNPKHSILTEEKPINIDNPKELFGAYIKVFFFPILVSIVGTLILMQVGGINTDIKEMRVDLNTVLRNPILQLDTKDILTTAQFDAYCKMNEKVTQEIQIRNIEAINQLRIDVRNGYLRSNNK